MTLRELRAKLEGTTTKLKEIRDAALARGGDLTEDETRQAEQLETDYRSTERLIRVQEMTDEHDRRSAGQPIGGTGDDRLDTELRSFSLTRAIASQVPNLGVDAGRERELSAELARRAGRSFQGMAVPLSVFHQPMEQRVITTTAPVGGPGSNLIATDHRGDLYIDRLRAALRVRQLGATVLGGLTGNVDIPKLKASATAGWVAENSALTPSDQQFASVGLLPKHAGAITEFSRNMLMQSSPDIEQLIRNDFAAILAEAVDRVAILGGGTNEPTGILATSGIGNVAIGTNGGPITWSAVIDLIAQIEVANASATAFLTNPKVVKSARKTPKVSSTDSVMVMEAPNSLAGYPLSSTNLVPSNLDKGTSTDVCSALIFGNWADLLLGYWSEFDLLVNPYESTAYSKGNVQVRGMLTMDVAVRHPESFAAIQDLTTP